MSMTVPTGSRPKGPALTYLALAAATIVMIAAVALNAAQPPPPTVAEFAPQANEQIKEPPPDQAGGPGPGGQPPPTAGPDASPTATPTGIPTNIPRTRRCYGDPPRQTEDPQSPPCADFWDPKRDNGGATWQGVTADEIRIAWPGTIEKADDTQRLATFFNTRFEFYGRKIVLVPFGPKGGVFNSGVSPSDMRADADFVDSQNVFASLSYVPRAGAEFHYYDRLAEHGIVSVDSHASMRTEEHYARRAPYQWGYLPAFDVMMRNFGEFVCRSLAGRAPRYAGETIRDEPERRFGLVYHVASDGSAPDRSILAGILRDCGAEVVPVEYPRIDDATTQQVALKLIDEDVTTVICLCQGDHYFNLMPAATRNVYFPEWLVSSYHYLDYDSAAQRYPAEHQDSVLGITFHNKWLPQKEMPWYHAIKEVDPEYETGDDGYSSAAYERYYELLVLASGIQMAGPNLTPQNFERGLFKADFPEPGSGRAPLYHPGGGFGPGDHTMVDDAAMIWYSPSDMSYTTNVRRGTYCYVRLGLRYGIGQWPRGNPAFFEDPCK